MAFGNGAASRGCLILVEAELVFAAFGYFWTLPCFQIEVLILQRMSKFMSEYRLLRVRGKPVQQIHALGLHIVVSGDLLLEKLDQKTVQIEIARQQPEFLEDHF